MKQLKEPTGQGQRWTLDRVLLWVLRPLIVVGIVSLFAESFWQSWSTLVRAATEAEIAHPGTWPWQVDGFLIVMALIIADAIRSRGTGWWGVVGVWWARIGLIAATALSTTIQAVYAPGDFPDGGWWMHAWNAPALLFSFECLVWLVYGGARKGIQQTDEDAGSRDGPPDVSAGGVAGSAGSHPTSLVGPPATPPRVPTAVATAAAVEERDTEGRNLPDQPPPVKDRGATVTAFPEKDHAALYRARRDRGRFERIIVARDLDREQAFALAARRGWPAANGTREEAHA